MKSAEATSRLEVWRSDAYRLLAACFYQPEREMLLQEGLTGNLATALRQAGAPADESCRVLEEELRRCSPEELLVEYAALFLGPFHVPASPYGSVYLEPHQRQLMGESTVRVGAMYRQAGLSQEFDGPPDHIAVELEFMSFLCRVIAMPAASGPCGDDAGLAQAAAMHLRREFFEKLLAPWIGPFCAAIREHAQLGFYRSLADCLESFISTEQHLHV
ncbi:MAG: hypothetical protein BWK76_20110 [Desulfobulbaceae bacterium A2]|nr:MAG: hypothetical protein BWK76_20110 [Desulfobulbaceae bacterium A2]